MTGKRVIYSCPFVPSEWIRAHGLTSSRIMPNTTGPSAPVAIGPGMCPYAHAFINAAVSDDGAAAVIVTTVCDQMRRAADLIERNGDLPVFLMNVPHTWQSPAARGLYISELRRLGRFMAELGGSAPSNEDLAAEMSRSEAARSGMRPGSASPRTQDGVPVALVGGPMLADQMRLSDLIEQAGGYVALDGTETGSRTAPAPFDERLIREDPLVALAEAYFGAIPDPFRRPNGLFYDWLGRELRERGIRGIILRRYIWCDTWHAEAERVREWAGLPLLHMDVGDDGTDDTRTLSRLQSFMEVLR